MTKFFLALGLLAGYSAAAQELPTPSPTTAPDTLGTLLLNGQRQPARPFLTVQDQLRTVAGVQVTPYDGAPGSGNVVRVRGASVAQGLSQPLYVIDGLPALNDDLTPGQTLTLQALQLNFGGTSQFTSAENNQEVGASPLQLLPPAAIAEVEVLAGPAAVARYGALGANGVISIRTRQGAGGRPLRLRYAAYAGVQQLRQRYDLLDATQYATVVNDAVYQRYGSSVASPYPSPTLGRGTDWQDEAYRAAGLQQHQLSLDGGRGGTTYLLSADYRRQAGVLRGSELTRLGLRLALGQQLGTRLRLQGSLALGQSTQRLPYTQGPGSATRAALLAPPTQPTRTAAGDYSGYDGASFGFSNQPSFENPLAVIDYRYRDPRTSRLLGQLGATYTLAPRLILEAGLNFQRTLLGADSYDMRRESAGGYNLLPPRASYHAGAQVFRASQATGRLALRYERQLAPRHQLGAELDYQYQAFDAVNRTENYAQPLPGYPTIGYAYYESRARVRLHRPWARLHYTLDSTLTLEASLSYARYTGEDLSRFYPAAQLSWHTPARARLAARLWLGLARTSTFGQGSTLFLPLRVGSVVQPGGGVLNPLPALYANQAEAGLRLASRRGHLTGQLVAYQRSTYHGLLNYPQALPGGGSLITYDETTLHNQGLELTLTADWQRGRVQGSTRLVGSLNRNRLRVDNPYSPAPDNQPTGTFYGYQQVGLTPSGNRAFLYNTTTNGLQGAVLGQGIPPQLLSLSQQLRLGRLALDAQLDGMFGYQLYNYQLANLDTPTGYTNSATTVLDRWTPANSNTSIPVAGAPAQPLLFSGPQPAFNYLLEDAAHLRLSSLTLSYRLRHTATQDLSVWVGGQNLFVLTSYRGYDPNVSSGGATPSAAGLDYGATPVPRSWLLGVSAGF